MASDIELMDNSQVPLRLAIINDYELVVAGLAGLLAGQASRVKVVEMTNRLPAVSDVDIVLMDTFASVTRGAFDVATVARHARAHQAQLVIYSWVTHPGSVERVLAQGAHSYLWKGLGAPDLLAALESVRSGRVVTPDHRLDDQPHDGASDPEGASWPGRQTGLSTREAEVLALIAKGLSNHEVARELFLGVNTVKTYIRTAYRKIGVTRRTQAVLWALDHGFTLQTKRALPEDEGAGFDTARYLQAIQSNFDGESDARTGVPPATDGAWQSQFNERVDQVQAIVPHCLGLSVASTLGPAVRTVMAASDAIAVLDATQYLTDGPCVEAAHTGTVIACTEANLLGKPAWRRFAVSATRAGVASTLSVPVVDDTRRVVGTINLYASTTMAFDRHHRALTEQLGSWARALITDDILSSGAGRGTPRPHQLHDDIATHVATSIVAEELGSDLDEARVRLDDAATRAGVATALLATTVRDIGHL